MIDWMKLRKGCVIMLKNGQKMTVTGLFLSTEGPVIMAKADPSLLAAVNVPLASIESIVEG